ncbi:hypothetical protein BOFL111202_16740 [Bordetella flabilis]
MSHFGGERPRPGFVLMGRGTRARDVAVPRGTKSAPSCTDRGRTDTTNRACAAWAAAALGADMIHPTRVLATSKPPMRAASPTLARYRRRRGVPAAMLAGAASVLIGAPAAAHELPTYRALVDALMAGQSVTVLLDLDRCSRDGSDVRGPTIRGGSRIVRFLIPNEQYVAFADTHPTLDTEDRPVVEYIRYRAMPDGRVTVRFARRTGSSDEIAPRGQFQCRFTRGVRFIAGEGPRALPARSRTDAPVQAPVQGGHTDVQPHISHSNPSR